MDQKNFEYGHFSDSAGQSSLQWKKQFNLDL